MVPAVFQKGSGERSKDFPEIPALLEQETSHRVGPLRPLSQLLIAWEVTLPKNPCT